MYRRLIAHCVSIMFISVPAGHQYHKSPAGMLLANYGLLQFDIGTPRAGYRMRRLAEYTFPRVQNRLPQTNRPANHGGVPTTNHPAAKVAASLD